MLADKIISRAQTVKGLEPVSDFMTGMPCPQTLDSEEEMVDQICMVGEAHLLTQPVRSVGTKEAKAIVLQRVLGLLNL